LASSKIRGYTGNLLRVDLSKRTLVPEAIEETTLQTWVGGTGLGAKYLYDEVLPGVEWSAPQNRLILSSGPLAGTSLGGSGAFSVVTKGAMTNGATSTQANGFMGAYMKFSGFDSIIVQGASSKWVYLYLHGGKAELKDATHLVGMDTWETAEAIRQELGKRKRELSVFAIGPAGEHMVRFAVIAGDEGHVCAHNGVGAVMGSKKLKAVVAERGEAQFPLHDQDKLNHLSKEILSKLKDNANPIYSITYNWGTSATFGFLAPFGVLPVKNLTTNVYPDYERWTGFNYRPRMERKRNPCWACQFNHCAIVKVKEGPYAGFVGEEPEYEAWAAWGPIIGQEDIGAAVMLSNEVDRLGMDTNEAGWLIAMIMECYERGIINRRETDGLEMNWGNAEATRAMLRKIAHREGVGDMLAEGVMRAARRMGGEAANCGVYDLKGNTPRGHDHRANWPMLIDTCVSQTGTDQAAASPTGIAALGLPADTNPATREGAVAILSHKEGLMPFEDTLGVCRFNIAVDLTEWDIIPALLNAATGWDLTMAKALQGGRRIVNLLKAFNIRHGHTAEMDRPSPRYGSAPVDGPAQGRTILPVWDKVREDYYTHMGWDKKTGKPLPETLRALGLDYVITDLWKDRSD
jgi:aldehyde:ferredoxin oxidoreductase